MTVRVDTTPIDWILGEQQLAAYAGGSTVAPYSMTFMASLQTVMSAEIALKAHMVAKAAAQFPAGPEGPAPLTIELTEAITDNVGGRAELAKSLRATGSKADFAIGTAYLAALESVGGALNHWKQVAPVSTKQLTGGEQLGIAPVVPIVLGVVAVVGLAAAAWWGTDKNEKVAQVEEVRAVHEVQAKQYSDNLAQIIAANAIVGRLVYELPVPPGHIRALADRFDKWPAWQVGAGIIVGGMAAYGLYKGYQPARAYVAARSNPAPMRSRRPRLTSSTTTRRRSPSRATPKRRANPKRKASTKRKANPKKTTTRRTIKNPIRKKTPRTRAERAGKPRKNDPKKVATKRKANPKKTTTTKRKANPRKKANPKDRYGRPSGDTPRAKFIRGQMRKKRSSKQAVSDWNAKQRLKKIRKNPAKKAARRPKARTR